MSVWSQLSFPDPKTENAKNLVLYHDMTLVVVALILVLVVWFLVLFLLGSIFFGGMMNRYVHSNDLLEIVWTVTPAFILFVLGYVSLVNLYQMEVGDESKHLVKVTGHQWYWDYEYVVDFKSGTELSSWFFNEVNLSLGDNMNVSSEGSDGVASSEEGSESGLVGKVEEIDVFVSDSNESSDVEKDVVDESVDMVWDWALQDLSVVLVGGDWSVGYDSFMIPAGALGDEALPFESGFRNADVTNPCFLAYGVNNEVLVCTVDVMHSWGLTELGVKVDAIPGRTNSLGIVPYSSGVSYGNCYELCGVGHSNMPIKVVVLSLDQLSWLMKMMVLDTEEALNVVL